MAQKTEDQAGPAAETVEKDSPLLDLTDQSVKKLIKLGKQRGYVTHDELNAVLQTCLRRVRFYLSGKYGEVRAQPPKKRRQK